MFSRTDETVYLFCAIGGAIMFGGIIWCHIKLRCPNCHSALPMRGMLPHYCPHCGEDLD